MQLPSAVYENLPYGYFLVSGALFTIGDSWPLVFSGAVFYLTACVVLVRRSAYRRLDKIKHKTKRIWLPELLYEFLPYTLSAVAIFLLMISTNNLVQFVAFALMVWAIRNLICRHNNRTRKQGLF